jgi:hypothetical protein
MSYNPSTNYIPMVKIGPEPLFLQEYTGRWAFLEALQIAHPKFWSDLRDLQGEPSEIEKWISAPTYGDHYPHTAHRAPCVPSRAVPGGPTRPPR